MKPILNGAERECSYAGCTNDAISYIDKCTAHPYACLNHFDDQLAEVRKQVDRLIHGGNVVPPLTHR